MKKNSGVTLVELAIVIVIIGILIAGVLVGRTLINQAKINAQITQIQDFGRAQNTFFLKYKKLPGDLRNASSFFGVASDMNGNGNGIIDPDEYFIYWSQLSLAGLIKGSFDGTTATTYLTSAINKEVPASSYNSAGAIAIIGSYNDTYVYFWDGSYGPAIASDGPFYSLSTVESTPENNTNYYGPMFIPQDAYAIDVKLDDGFPGSGKITVVDSRVATGSGDSVSGCMPDDYYTNMPYSYASPDDSCVMFIQIPR